jgi:hypothetical protein
MSLTTPYINIGVIQVTAPPPPPIAINDQPKASNVWDFENDWHDGIFYK